MTQGRPISASTRRASSIECATPERAQASPQLAIALRKRSRSSALRMTSARAPIISIPRRSRTPAVVEGERRVQPGLAPERRQQRVGALLLEDLRDRLERDRLDVDRVGRLRVRHDRRRIRVDEDDAVALLARALQACVPE
jgi:hypothetical protein